MFVNLDDIFGNYSNEEDITVLDIIKDFAEANNCYSPIKGGLALSYLYDDAQPSARNTVDIDYHFESKDHWELFKKQAFHIATENSKLNINYNLIGEKVNPNGESLSIEFISSKLSGKFKIDMNFGDYCKTIQMKNIILYSPEMILADKLSVVCSPKIQRRCKDLYDIFLVISHENFKFKELVKEIEKKLKSRNIELGKLSILNPSIIKNLKDAYRKIKLIDMPDFEDVCTIDLKFILPILSYFDGNKIEDMLWNHNKKSWNTGKIYASRLGKDLEGIICKETASGLLGLSTFPPFPVLTYNTYVDINMGIVRFIKDERIDNIIPTNNDTYITNEERTIIDMLEDGEYRILEESIISYNEKHTSLDNLISVAKSYNKLDLLKSILEEMLI